MIKESRLFNFINKEKTFAISFLEGQKVIHDLALIHSVNQKGFGFLRDAALSILPMINFLKPQENMGIFLDSQEPYLRFKLEMNQAGFFRTLVLPEELPEVPRKISGNLRTVKQFPHSKTPYTSIIEVRQKAVKEIINDFFKKSYQMNSVILLSEDSDQVALITKLPEVNVDKEEVTESVPLAKFVEQSHEAFDSIFKKALNDEEEIKDEFNSLGYEYLKSTEIKFKCSCSRDRMVTGVASVVRTSGFNDVFHDDQSIETKCDYCKTAYLITKEEVSALLNLQ